MANYNVGNIEVGVISSSNSVSKDLDNLLKNINKIERLDKAVRDSFISINKLGNGLNKIQRINMTNINSQFEKISHSTKTLNEKLNGIQNPNFSETANALNKLGNAFRQFDKLKNFDFRNMYNSFNSLNRMLTPFLQKLKASEQSLVAFSNVLNNLKAKTITKATNEVNKLSKETSKVVAQGNKINFKKWFNIGKIYFLLNYTKRFAQGLANIVNTAINFEETLNKFQVSFANFSDEATAFANKLTYAFNLSRKSIMDYMSTFNSMLNGLGGISTSQAYTLSKTITQLSLDYSSLFNIDVDRSMEQFQSVLSGQIRSIRSVSGIDVSENTIFQYYKELGGTKTIRQLSQLEKRLLRIYAVEKQMDSLGAIGDLEKTIDSASNQIKQIKETWSEAFVYIGNVALQVIKPIITGFLTFSLVVKDISKYFAQTMNAFTNEYEQSGSSGLFGEITDSADEASESVNELLGLLSFDKFEALSQNTTSNLSDTDLTMISNALAQYESNFANIESKARSIANNILQWLGFQQEINEATGETNLTLEKGYTNLEKIKDIVLSLVALGLSALVIKLSKGIYTMSISLTTATASVKNLNLILGTTLIASLINLVLNFDNLSTTAKMLNSVILALSTTLLLFKNRLLIKKAFIELIGYMTLLELKTSTLKVALLGVASALGIVALGFTMWNAMDKWSAKTKIIIGTLGILATALMAAAIAWITYHGAMTLGVAVPLITTAITAGVLSAKALYQGVKQYKDGGMPKEGQMFIANEAGAELVGSFDGKTGVANNDMITSSMEQACYRGFMKAMSTSDNATNVNLYFSTSDSAVARALFNPLLDEAKRNGYNVKER